ncbi:MAG: exonuclease domain-containing protein [Oscillospiraceae bacterium]
MSTLGFDFENGKFFFESSIDRYNEEPELSLLEEKAITIIKNAFNNEHLPFDEVILRRRSESYLTLLTKEYNSEYNNDFCRIKVGPLSAWISLDMGSCKQLQDDYRFANVSNKKQRHWKISLDSISSIEDVTDLIINAFKIIHLNLNIETEKIIRTAQQNTQNKKDQQLNTAVDNYTVVDIETTGLSRDSEIIEIGAVKVRNNEIIDKFDMLIKPSAPIPYNITSITGITNEMVQNAPTFCEVIKKFLDFIEDDVLIGHNINSFDMKILSNNTMKACGIFLKNPTIDTLAIARKNIVLSHYRLSDLCEHLGVKNDNAHRALSDSIATNECYQQMKHYKIGSYKTNLSDKKDAKPCQSFSCAENVAGKRICLTGDFKIAPRDIIKEHLTELGAKVTTSISSKTNYLLIGDNGTTTTHKITDAQNLGVTIVYEKDFIKITE